MSGILSKKEKVAGPKETMFVVLNQWGHQLELGEFTGS